MKYHVRAVGRKAYFFWVSLIRKYRLHNFPIPYFEPSDFRPEGETTPRPPTENNHEQLDGNS